MKKLLIEIAAILNKYRRHKAWRRVVRALACVVVFCTTYALILPAITLENPGCGFREHEHGLDCYQQLTTPEESLTCTLAVSAEHEHSGECFTMAEIPVDGDLLTCGLEESTEHFHAPLCYGHWELACDLPIHIHTDACSEPLAPVDETDPTAETTEETTEPTEPELLELVYSDETVIVTAAYGPEANIPEGAQLVVLPITPESHSDTYQLRFDEAQQALAEGETVPEITMFALYDIYFEFEGQVIQPNESVSVTIQFLNEAEAVAGTPVSVVHFAEDGTEVLESTDIDESASTTFHTDGFSVYGISLLAVEEEEGGAAEDGEDGEDGDVTEDDDAAEDDETTGDGENTDPEIVPAETIPAAETADEHLIAYFSFDDYDKGFSSVTTDAAGTKIVNGEPVADEELPLSNGDFEVTDDEGYGTSTNWGLTGYSSVAKDGSATNNKTNALNLWLSDAVEDFGSASYTVTLEPGTYYFTFELSGQGSEEEPIDSGLRYSVTAGETVLAAGDSSYKTLGWDNWLRIYTKSFTVKEPTDVTFTLSGTQPANYWGWLDNLKLYRTTDYIDAKADIIGNVSTAAGYKGNAVRLSANNYLKVTDREGESLLSTLPNFSELDAITVSYWSKPTSSSGKNWSFFALPDDTKLNIWNTDQNDLSILEEGSYRLQQDHYIPNTRHERRISGGTVNTEWHYITAVFSNSKTTLYVNGIKIGETEINELTSLQSILGENSTVQIGKANYATNGEFYDGYIDEYRIYDIALSEDEIIALYESEAKEVRPYQDTLLAYFDFNNIAYGFTDAKTGAKATTSESVTDYYNSEIFYFKGDNYLTVTKEDGSSLLTGCNEITVSYWSNPDVAKHTNWGFYAAPDENTQVGGSDTYLGLLENDQYKLEQYNKGRGNPENNLSSGAVKANEWHYITAVYSETELRLYIDGQLIAKNSNIKDASPTEILGENSILQIGKANWTANGEYYKGYIDEYRIYSSALTDSDVAQLYHNEVKKPPTYTTARAVPTDFSSLESGKQYLIYTQDADGNYYAIAARPGDTIGYAVPITFNEDGAFSWPADMTDNFFWTFSNSGGANSYLITSGSGMHLHAYNNGSAHGTVTEGAYASALEAVYDSDGNPDGSFIATGNTYYTGLQFDSVATNTKNDIALRSNLFVEVDIADAAHLRLATIDYNTVWLDGTDGGIMAFSGSPDEPRFCLDSLTLPETWDSPGKYGYTLRGWYDLTDSKYYQPGDTVTDIQENRVFYADWEPTTYDYGQDNSHVANTLDTSDFVSIEMFDYNALFNVQSLHYTGTVTETGHSETWELVNAGEAVPYNNMPSLNFLFRDWDAQFIDISYPNKVNNVNDNNTNVTSGIVGSVGASAPALLDVLFNRYTDVIGKNFVGNANHLFQYVDPVHDPDHIYEETTNIGYYYYDSKYNAASYSKSDQRFYVYNYRERTTDSTGKTDTTIDKDAINYNDYSDFLPFNSPYVPHNGKTATEYQLPLEEMIYDNTHYQYDAKDVNNNCLIANYSFGMKVNINFFLPHDSASDGSNRLNQAELGGDMLFGFDGDDDLWVFLDGQLVLDVGGIHGVRSGTINFSTGEVTVNGNPISESPLPFTSGDHTLTVYYLERGSSQSNCAIYFNLAPSRYGLELTKKDFDDSNVLPGAKFSIYLDPECTQLAPVWHSEDEKKENELPVTEFTVDSNGKLTAWGFVLGKTYYLKEISPPDGYLVTDDIIAFTMHTQGTLSYADVTVLPGADGRDPGLEVIRNQITRSADNTTSQQDLKLALELTNQKNTTQVTVDKQWKDTSTENLPAVTVRLLQNGSKYGDAVTLSIDKGWKHTWNNLPITDRNGNKFVYTVEEDVPPGYTARIEDITSETAIEWINVAVLEDDSQYLLTNDGKALTVNSSGALEWVDLDTGNASNALWTAEAYESGFLLKFGDYKLTLNEAGDGFTASAGDGNQIIYYDGASLYALSGGHKCDFSLGSSVVLQKPEMIMAKHFKITNTQGYKLPDTGSSFTLIYTASGLAVMAMAVLLEMKRRRKHA